MSYGRNEKIVDHPGYYKQRKGYKKPQSKSPELSPIFELPYDQYRFNEWINIVIDRIVKPDFNEEETDDLI